MKTVCSLLVLALPIILSSYSAAEEVLQKEAVDVQSNAESQQVSVATDTGLDKSATVYDLDFVKGGIRKEYDIADYQGVKGFKDNLAYHGKKGGDHGKSIKASYHDKGGKSYHGHDDQKKYHGKHKHGLKGSKGHHAGSKGHIHKGHKNKGFKNLYHKEEYGINKVFYDDDDFTKYHNVHDDFDDHFASQKGGFNKGSNYKGGNSHNTYGDKGDFKNGEYHDSHGGKKGSYGNNEHYDRNSKFDQYGETNRNLGGYGGLGHGSGGHHVGLGHHRGGLGYGNGGHHVGIGQEGYGAGGYHGGIGHGGYGPGGNHGENGHGTGGYHGGIGHEGYGTGENHGGIGHETGLGRQGIHGSFRPRYSSSNNLGVLSHRGDHGNYGPNAHGGTHGISDIELGHIGGYATSYSNFNMKYH